MQKIRGIFAEVLYKIFSVFVPIFHAVLVAMHYRKVPCVPCDKLKKGSEKRQIGLL